MSKPDKPDQQRPEHPAFWDHRFDKGVTPWDAGGVPAALQAFAARHGSRDPAGQPRRVLVPGCGSAHDAAFLDRLGWAVTALDFSAGAVDSARRNLGDWNGTLVQADFFAHRPELPYALVYERAFLCALPRKLWPDYGERMAQLLDAGGCLAGFYLFGDELKGPPFPIVRQALEELLAPYFDLEADEAVADSIPVFAGRERWMVWRRR
ncbi:MAG: methyltransferase domain-containing protein [Rhodocyclaceae bacterium]|nr:methyltransferase domain-containing protein [Rhodocyclaceae bacterium]